MKLIFLASLALYAVTILALVVFDYMLPDNDVIDADDDEHAAPYTPAALGSPHNRRKT